MKITVGLMRDLEKQVMREEISYSRMVEILNETANKSDFEKWNAADQQTSALRRELEEKDKALNYCHKRMAGAYDEINRLNKLLNHTT